MWTGAIEVNKDLTAVDPLITFRCRNHQCKEIFTPNTLLNVKKHMLSFDCPICGTKYEAQYTDAGIHNRHKIIMLLEYPKMVYLGTRIASS